MTAYSKRQIRDAVRSAFHETHEGWSTDDVIIDDELDARFVEAATDKVPGVPPQELNWQLMNLRKSGKLGAVTTVRHKLPNRDEYIHAAEIAARFMEDSHSATIDRVMCNPKARREFDRIARSVAPGHTSYCYRKAALGLRKAGKFKPELVNRLFREGTKTRLLDAETVLADDSLIPGLPGVYMFADETGALYIGESEHLRSRVLKHLDHSDRKSLAHYLWEQGIKNIKVQTFAFSPDQLGADAKHRRILEASLIQSRNARFNIQHK